MLSPDQLLERGLYATGRAVRRGAHRLRRPPGPRGLLVGVLIAMVGFTFVLTLDNRHDGGQFREQARRIARGVSVNLHQQRLSCVAGGRRMVYQLRFDAQVYRHAPSAGEWASMKRIAQNRIDVQFARELPASLARVVRREGFSCDRAYAR